MAIVLALLGLVFTVFPQILDNSRLVYNIPFGVVLAVLGIAMSVLFGLVDRRPVLSIPILVIATLTAIVGIAAVILVMFNPFSWMIAIVSLAVFIDALCLEISLRK